MVCFNPRTRVGCDRVARQLLLLKPFQSTHPRGVRPSTYALSKLLACFNPRTRVGCDISCSSGFHGVHVSIHAPAWGATFNSNHIPHRHCFNPRTRVGCDLYRLGISSKSGVSIHAPAWGATWGVTTPHPKSCVSIHAPAWGATNVLIKLLLRTGFNPRTRVGCDL